MEHLIRIITPELLELGIRHTDSAGVRVHSVAALSSSCVDRVEDTLKRASCPLLWNSERRQRGRQGQNLVLSKASALTLRGNTHHHVCNLRLRRNRLRTKISNLIRKNLVAVPRALGGLLQATHHLAETTKCCRCSLDVHLRHRRKLSNSRREVLQVLRRNVHLRAECTDLRKVSKRGHNLLRRQIRVRLTKLGQILCRALCGTLHVGERTLLCNASLRSSRHQRAEASRNCPVIHRRVAGSITNILNRLLVRTELCFRLRGIDTHHLALARALLLNYGTLRTASFSLTSSSNASRCSHSSSLALRLSGCCRTGKLQLSLLQRCRSLNLGKTSSLVAFRLHQVTLVPALLSLQRDSVILMLHTRLSTKLLSLRLSLTGLRLVQRRLGLLRLILGLGHGIRRRSHLTHSRSSILQLSYVILAQVVHRASLTDELSICRNSLIDTSREIGLTNITRSLIQRTKRIGHRPQRCR